MGSHRNITVPWLDSSRVAWRTATHALSTCSTLSFLWNFSYIFLSFKALTLNRPEWMAWLNWSSMRNFSNDFLWTSKMTVLCLTVPMLQNIFNSTVSQFDQVFQTSGCILHWIGVGKSPLHSSVLLEYLLVEPWLHGPLVAHGGFFQTMGQGWV